MRHAARSTCSAANRYVALAAAAAAAAAVVASEAAAAAAHLRAAKLSQTQAASLPL